MHTHRSVDSQRVVSEWRWCLWRLSIYKKHHVEFSFVPAKTYSFSVETRSSCPSSFVSMMSRSMVVWRCAPGFWRPLLSCPLSRPWKWDRWDEKRNQPEVREYLMKAIGAVCLHKVTTVLLIAIIPDKSFPREYSLLQWLFSTSFNHPKRLVSFGVQVWLFGKKPKKRGKG